MVDSDRKPATPWDQKDCEKKLPTMEDSDWHAATQLYCERQ